MIRATGFRFKALAASLAAQPMVEMTQIPDFTFGGLVHLAQLAPTTARGQAGTTFAGAGLPPAGTSDLSRHTWTNTPSAHADATAGDAESFLLLSIGTNKPMHHIEQELKIVGSLVAVHAHPSAILLQLC